MLRSGLCVITVLFAAACTPSRAATQQGLPPGEVWLTTDELTAAGVVSERVDQHDVDDVLLTSGRVAFDEARVAHVVSPVSGRIEKISGDLGATVTKGQTLAVIHSPDLGDATSDLNKAMADLIATQHAYQRAKDLRAENAASDAVVEQAQDSWRNAKAEVERAQQKVALFHAGRAVTEIYPLVSPIAGRVLARNVYPGYEVQGAYAGGSQPELFTVGDLEDVWVFADVYETDLGRVHAGQDVQVTVTGLPAALTGKVDYVSDMLDPQTRTARLRCTIPNPKGQLLPEMYGTVRVSVAPRQALAVPRSAILHLGGQQLVFVKKGASPDGRTRFERLPINADETGGNVYVPVDHVLDKGDEIVVKGGEVLSGKL
jgi:cobalt-zinc-cadmium efflux system membrane fusion protein